MHAAPNKRHNQAACWGAHALFLFELGGKKASGRSAGGGRSRRGRGDGGGRERERVGGALAGGLLTPTPIGWKAAGSAGCHIRFILGFVHPHAEASAKPSLLSSPRDAWLVDMSFASARYPIPSCGFAGAPILDLVDCCSPWGWAWCGWGECDGAEAAP